MARPAKKGLKYFNIDCIQEDNLNYIEAKHGITGYGVLVKLWRKIYMLEGYYTHWTEKNIYLFAREIGVDIGMVCDIVNSCFAEQIFSTEMFEKHQILTSKGIQKRYLKIVTEAKRKDTEIDSRYRLIELTPEKETLSREETPDTTVLTTQKKRNEKKENNKTSGAVPALPTLVDVSSKGKITEPYWRELVEVWFSFVTEKFGEPPFFTGEDPRFLKSIVGKLKQRAASKNEKWDTVSAQQKLRVFLGNAFNDEWLRKHYLLKTLDARFEEIGRSVSVSKKIIPTDPETEIQELYEKSKKMKPAQLPIESQHYDYLEQRGMISIKQHHISEGIRKRINNLCGSNQAKDLKLLQAYETNPSKASENDPNFLTVVKRIAMLEFFYHLEQRQVQRVF